MKLLAFVLIGQVILVNASPILLVEDEPVIVNGKTHATATSNSKITPLGKESTASAAASARLFRRELAPSAPSCAKVDYKLIQEKVTLALEHSIEKLIKDQVVRKKRATSANAASSVDAGGKTSSSASALHSPDANLPVVETRVPPGKEVEGLEPVHSVQPVPSRPVDPVPSRPVDPVPSRPVDSVDPVPHVPGRKHSKIQKVNASANMETGTAIATATSKRSADFQKVTAAGNKAIASAKNSNDNGSNTQIVDAKGGDLAVASAVSGSRNEPAPSPVMTGIHRIQRDTNVQKVSASGNKAIASAKNHKAGETNIQSVVASGGELAVASASSDGSEPVPALPLPVQESGQPGQPGLTTVPEPDKDLNKTESHRVQRDANVQKVSASGNKAIASAKNHKAGETNIQNVEASGGELAVASASSDGLEPVPALPVPALPVPVQESGQPGQPGLPAIPEKDLNKIHKRDVTVQNVNSKGNTAISKAETSSEGVSSIQVVTAAGKDLAVSTAVHSKRSACDLINFDDSIKSLISKAVADAFLELKL